MLLSLNWLKKFVNIPKSITPAKLAELLTLSTVEVESVKQQDELLDQVVVGRVEKLEEHPNADKLKVAYVDIHKNTKTQKHKNTLTKVVCGGVNLREGMLVAFAQIGARVKWHGEGEPVKLEKAKIRGIESSGMICSASELGLESIFPQETEYHIVDLSGVKGVKVGQLLAQALGLDDVIIEIENKSLTNRPDLWSHYGMAREIAALLGLKLKVNKVVNKVNKIVNSDKLKVEIRDNKKCSRYLGVVIDGIKIEPSPVWLSRQLEAVGVRSINNIVDITNYVLIELGQPLHAFDYENLANQSRIKSRESVANIIVRRAKEEERITTLDGIERQLASDDLVIADPQKPVALAGVMGGASSEISDNTTKIIIESANFEAGTIRRTEARTGLRTEASIRFEKALDPNLAELGIKRAIELILKLCPTAKVTSSIIDVGTYKPQKRVINLDLNYLNRLVGKSIPAKKVINILESLEFKLTKHEARNMSQKSKVKNQKLSPRSEVESKVQSLTVEVPSFRATSDVTIPEDLIEEVSRIYGYGNIEPQMPKVKLSSPPVNAERQLERQVKNILTTGFGCSEVQNYSFINPKVAAYFGYSQDDLIGLDNPITPEQSCLRPTLLINLLRNVKDNLRFSSEFKLFEIGRIFIDAKLRKQCETAKMRKSFEGSDEFNTDLSNKEMLPNQDKFLSGVVVGKDVFKPAKAAVTGLLEQIGLDYQLVPSSNPTVCPNGQCSQSGTGPAWADNQRLLTVKSSGQLLGSIAELCPCLRSPLKLKPRIGVFDVNFTQLAKLSKNQAKQFEELPIYPSVTRDLAIIVSQGIMYSDIAELINRVSPLIVSVELFDVYIGKSIGEGQRSLAFHLVFRAPDRTLESKEADEILGEAVKKLGEKFGARIR